MVITITHVDLSEPSNGNDMKWTLCMPYGKHTLSHCVKIIWTQNKICVLCKAEHVSDFLFKELHLNISHI